MSGPTDAELLVLSVMPGWLEPGIRYAELVRRAVRYEADPTGVYWRARSLEQRGLAQHSFGWWVRTRAGSRTLEES